MFQFRVLFVSLWILKHAVFTLFHRLKCPLNLHFEEQNILLDLSEKIKYKFFGPKIWSALNLFIADPILEPPPLSKTNVNNFCYSCHGRKYKFLSCLILLAFYPIPDLPSFLLIFTRISDFPAKKMQKTGIPKKTKKSYMSVCSSIYKI